MESREKNPFKKCWCCGERAVLPEQDDDTLIYECDSCGWERQVDLSEGGSHIECPRQGYPSNPCQRCPKVNLPLWEAIRDVEYLLKRLGKLPVVGEHEDVKKYLSTHYKKEKLSDLTREEIWNYYEVLRKEAYPHYYL
ncbi:MAG TPA: hypothetical protein V6D25_30930 [Leptolyngbyaceae cyanobacterium]